ncbi:porin family protein [Algibacter sp. L4_22]|uniref:porin family protein n=1 Tax=Algibacter sp. L4_22 TaxID=2942477 RepID=UPI00201B5EBC|nr:porin family protein [Algibacter sp. L4_22]MCL5127543.1 PorT family protein [Algibacter sp. L4_22]
MIKIRLLLVLLFCSNAYLCFSQEGDNPTIDVDNNYREDQFYLGVTYNLLGLRPDDVSQSGFSSGIHLGFIKDMPINTARNKAIGFGIGLSANSYVQNLLIQKDDDGLISYSVLDSDTYTKNKFSRHFVEIPLEFRWRTSTATSYEFWRIYAGFKFSYMLANTTKYDGDLGSFKYTNISDFNKLQYGLTISAGYNTWNLHLYYALNPVFSKDAKLSGESMDMHAIRVGLMFYIL